MISDPNDLLLVAGGDGTVRKAVREVLHTKLLKASQSIVILPMGTANNISKTLQQSMDVKEIISKLRELEDKEYDVGRLFGVKKQDFFLESFGFGVFPLLMKEMSKFDKAQFATPQASIKKALQLLKTIVKNYKPEASQIEIDGRKHEGRFLMAEVMNASSIGPNLKISPLSDPGDGYLEVVLIPESQRAKLLAYIEARLKNKKLETRFNTIKGTKVSFECKDENIHADDKVVDLKKDRKVQIHLKKGLVKFRV
jgi:diacylglycerol kinase family enzyme